MHGPGLRALVVDDEEPALAELRFRLEELAEPAFASIDLVATSAEAIRAMRSRPYDVVFLDIQMPGLSGLELAELIADLRHHPAVVFVTAYDEYAVRAFDLGAADYLLKPVSPERLRRTLERVRGAPSPAEPVAMPGPGSLDKLPVEAAGRTILIDVPEIRFAEARGDIVSIKTRNQRYPTRYSLAELERRLPQPPFLRIHRAFIVNLRNVLEIRPYFNGAYLLTADDDAVTELTVSRGHVRGLRSLLGF
jgi:DNA-binding LytR/AlgR family response regulator